MDNLQSNSTNTETATFGGGCFWCTEAIFQSLKGVSQVDSGYMGGQTVNPTYEQVCNGDTGHAEIIQIIFDPTLISFKELLLVFFKTHNPTTLIKQGNDIGTQYRSVVFYHNEDQKAQTIEVINELTAGAIFDKSIVTEISPATEYYKAEDYHQNYFNRNSGQSYCAVVIQPKLAKFAENFREKIKPELL